MNQVYEDILRGVKIPQMSLFRQSFSTEHITDIESRIRGTVAQVPGIDRISGKTVALAAGVALALAGWLWNFVFPINKALWSSSFTCAVAGYSLIMFSLFYYIIDVRGWHRWAEFFVVIGLNSITIYMAQRFCLLDGIQHKLFDGCIDLAPENLRRVAEELSWIATCWLFLYILYRKKIFLKV